MVRASDAPLVRGNSARILIDGPQTFGRWLDAIAGILFAVSPWVLAFDQHVWIPHVALGVAEVVGRKLQELSTRGVDVSPVIRRDAATRFAVILVQETST